MKRTMRPMMAPMMMAEIESGRNRSLLYNIIYIYIYISLLYNIIHIYIYCKPESGVHNRSLLHINACTHARTHTHTR